MIYMLALICSLNLFSWWWFWLVLEFLNWVLMLMMKKKNIMLIFLLWQSLASLMILFFLMINLNFFLIVMFTFMKSSFPPFHYLFWNLHFFTNWKVLVIFLTIHKFLPLLFMTMFIMKIFLLFIVFFPILLFSLFWNNLNLPSNLFMFMLSDSCWMLFSFMVSLKLMVVYMMLNLMIFFYLYLINIKNTKFINNILTKICILLITSLPPFFSFLLKFIIVYSVNFELMIMFMSVYFISFFFFESFSFLELQMLIYSKLKWI
uniref:NADH dehydrogenase subunit 2 n=1 Tax=Romanomermis iyengari TaxID=416168 RepID=A1Z3A8_ROMIY|nr:NADH dehydrogenase subunit 2 [Romanomermis iyengari]ABL73791.1 NADH dehydrogenase subunit 2 [Romanomermis iyengari]